MGVGSQIEIERGVFWLSTVHSDVDGLLPLVAHLPAGRCRQRSE